MEQEDAKAQLEAVTDEVDAASQAVSERGRFLAELLDLKAESEELEQAVTSAESAVYSLLKARLTRGEAESLSEYCDVLERELNARKDQP